MVCPLLKQYQYQYLVFKYKHLMSAEHIGILKRGYFNHFKKIGDTSSKVIEIFTQNYPLLT